MRVCTELGGFLRRDPLEDRVIPGLGSSPDSHACSCDVSTVRYEDSDRVATTRRIRIDPPLFYVHVI